MEKRENRSTRYGRAAALMTAVVLLITLVLNVLVYQSVEKFNWKFDMTSSKLYELTDTTLGVLDELDMPVEIIALNNEDDFYSDVREVLRRYAAASDMIELRYVDVVENANFVSDYAAKGLAIEKDGIIVKSDLREKVYTLMDMYNIDQQAQQITSFKAEQQITSALLYVTNDEIPVAAFTQGHNEYMGNAFPALFEQNNYTTSQLTLTVQDIAEDVGLIVIAAPTRDFETSEIQKLDEFMARGGSLMIFMHPASEPLPNLNAFMEEWGITVGDNVVFEAKEYTGSPINVVPRYFSHTINTYFTDNKYFMVMPQCRNLILDSSKSGKVVMPVLMTSDEAYGKVGTEFSTAQREEGDASGPFYLAATSSETVNVGGEKKDAKMFVCGSRSMYFDDVLGITSYANADFLVQVMSWCGEGLEVANVPAKDMSASMLNITAFVALILIVVLVIVIPFGLLAKGVIVFLRRRHL
ncbi:MAG: Gldg family protein [Eubacteriales bacterium]